MDQTKAQRLLHKIQAFLDNGSGQELSRLEKDLIKSYIVQLYDAVNFESTAHVTEPKHQETHDYKKQQEEVVTKKETPIIRTPEPKQDFYKPEPPKEEYHKPEPPKEEYYKPEPPKVEPVVPAYIEYVPPVIREEPIEVKPSLTEYIHSSTPPEHKPYQYQPDPVVETVKVQPKIESTSSDQLEVLNKIFDQQKSDEMSHRFTQAPIPSIESAMGLNERIFTLNELFGGDKMLFDSTCQRLNGLNSLDEARQVLMNGPARDYKWSDAERIKMAEQFIRIVARRYHKNVS